MTFDCFSCESIYSESFLIGISYSSLPFFLSKKERGEIYRCWVRAQSAPNRRLFALPANGKGAKIVDKEEFFLYSLFFTFSLLLFNFFKSQSEVLLPHSQPFFSNCERSYLLRNFDDPSLNFSCHFWICRNWAKIFFEFSLSFSFGHIECYENGVLKFLR